MQSSEKETRIAVIDSQLCIAGWDVQDPTKVVQEFDILTNQSEGVAEPHQEYGGHQYSDYVLLGKDGKPLAVVEAKRTSKDAALGREQAKQYCYNIQKQLGGELLYQWARTLFLGFRKRTAASGLRFPHARRFGTLCIHSSQSKAVVAGIH